MSNHRSDDDKYAKKPKRRASGGGQPPLAIMIGGVILFAYAIIMTIMFYSKSSQLKGFLTTIGKEDTRSAITMYNTLKRDLDNAVKSRKTADSAARSKVQGEINRLQRESNVARSQADEALNEKLPEAEKKLERHGVRETAFMDQVGWLMDRTRRESKRMVLERCVLAL